MSATNAAQQTGSNSDFEALFDSFTKTASELFSYSSELGKSVPGWLVEGQATTREARTQLTEVASSCGEETVAVIYRRPAEAIPRLPGQLFGLTRDLTESVRHNKSNSSKLMKWLEEHRPVVMGVNPDQLQLSTEQKRTAVEWMVASKYSLFIQNFYTALPSLAVFNLISMWHEALLAFLGRKPNKHFDVWAGTKKMFEELPSAIIDHVVPFGAPVIQGVRTALKSPMKRDIEVMSAAAKQTERAVKLEQFASNFEEQVKFVREIITRSEEANRESFEDLQRKGAALLEILQPPPAAAT